MIRRCSKCGRMVHDGDRVFALVKSTFREIASKKAYAIEKPTECYALTHEYCQTDGEVGR